MAKKIIKKGLLWIKDIFRRRPTEKLKFARYPSKRSVVIGPVRKVEGKNAFEADFVPPRKFSQLNPFGDHHTALSIELAVYQVARAALTKFEGLNNSSIPLVKNESVWKRFPSIESKVLIKVEQTTVKKIHGREMRFFETRVVDKNNPETVFGTGKFGITLIKKQ